MSVPTVEILRSGRWTTGEAHGFVWLVRQDYDYYYDDLTEGEPDLGPDGWAYYLLYGHSMSLDQHDARSRTFASEAEALKHAREAFEDLRWDIDSE